MNNIVNNVTSKVTFANELIEYNKYYVEYKELANKLTNQFVNHYKKECKSLDDVVEKGIDIATSYLLQALESTVHNTIKKYKIYELNLEDFVNQFYEPYMNFEEYTNIITDQYAEIVFAKEALEEYRKSRKNNRARIVGGGFGVKGAVKGMALAGTANMVSGAAHSIFNSFGKAISNAKINNTKREIFESKEPLKLLKEGLLSNIFKIHFALIDMLNYLNLESIKIIDKSDINKSKSIFNNLKSGLVDEKDKESILLELISMNPYFEDVYIYLLELFGDKNGEIEKLANSFMVDIYTYKLNILNKKVTSILKRSSSKQIRFEIEKFIENMMHLGFEGKVSKGWIEKLETHYSNKEVEERTLDGIVFETVALMKEALKEKEKLKNILNKNQLKNSQEIEIIIKEIESSKWNTNYYEVELEKLYDKYANLKNKEDEAIELERINNIVKNANFNSSIMLSEKVNELQNIKFKTEAGKQKVKEYENKVKKLRNKEQDNLKWKKQSSYFALQEKYKKALEQEKRRSRPMILKLLKWAFIISLFMIAVSFLNTIGLIVSSLIIIGYIASMREEKRYWNELTNNGERDLKDIKNDLSELKKSLK